MASVYTANTLLGWSASSAWMVLVYGETQSTTIAAAMLLCNKIAPALLVPKLGVAVDRLPFGVALGGSLGASAAVLAVLGGLGYSLLIFPLALIAGTASTLVRGLLRTGVARTLRGDDLRSGNAFLNIVSGVAGLLGPALAAFVIAQAGIAAALLVTAGLIALTGVGAALVPVGRATADDEAATPDTAPATRQHGSPVPLLWLLALVGAVSCIFSMDDPALLAYSEQSLGAGVGGYGAIFMAWGIGIAVGGLVFARLLHWPMLRIYALATVLAALAYLGMSMAPTIAVACAIAVVGGIGNGMDWVALVTAIQEATPRGLEARTAMRLEAIGTAGPGVGILLGGIIADLASPRVTLLVPGVAALVILAIGLAAVRARAAALGAGPAPQSFSPSINGGSV